MGKSGIYGIFNLVNGKVYIGSAVDLNKRLKQHEAELINKRHTNSRLQNAWNKYGLESFEFHSFEYCDKQELLKKEQLYIDLCKSYNDEFGYNICPTAGSNLGRKYGDDFKKMRSIKNKQMMTPEMKARISKTLTGRIGWKHTEESKKKLSEAHKGKKLSEKTKKKLAIINIGKSPSLETRMKLSKSLKGHKGAIHTEEFKRKISLFTSIRLKEKYKDIRERQKTSDAIRLWWQKRKCVNY